MLSFNPAAKCIASSQEAIFRRSRPLSVRPPDCHVTRRIGSLDARLPKRLLKILLPLIILVHGCLRGFGVDAVLIKVDKTNLCVVMTTANLPTARQRGGVDALRTGVDSVSGAKASAISLFLISH